MGPAGSWKSSWDGAVRPPLHPGHAAPGTSDLGEGTWVESCLHQVTSCVSLADLCLSFLICNPGIVMVTTSQDGSEGKFSEHGHDNTD